MAVGKWLLTCAALGVGVALGLACGGWSLSIPAGIVFLLLVGLAGYGFEVRGWPWALVLLIGFLLAGHDQGSRERVYRDKFWLRGQEARQEQRVSLWPKARHALAKRVSLGLEHDSETAALNRAILLGEKRRVPAETRQIFIEAGTLHIFAISGLHVMIVAQVILLLVRCLGVGTRFSGLVAVPVLFLYLAVIGFPPSAVRAGLMAGFYFLAPVFWRKPDGLVAWCQTFCLVHLIAPSQLTNVSSALSFAVMLGILLAVRLVRRFKSALLGSLLVGLAAWAAGVPIAAHVFGRVTPGSLLANLLLIPAAWFSVFTGTLGVVVSFISTTIAIHLNNFAALFTRAMVGLSALVGQIPGSNLEVQKWTLLQCSAWYLAVVSLGGLIYYLTRRRELI